jgi:hypothetical protein
MEKRFDVVFWHVLGFQKLGKGHGITVSKLQRGDFFVLGDTDEDGSALLGIGIQTPNN